MKSYNEAIRKNNWTKLRRESSLLDNQFGFIPGRSTLEGYLFNKTTNGTI